MEETVKEKTEEEKIEEIKKKVNEVLDLGEMEELVTTNEKIFEEKGITYRVHKPNYKEKKEAYEQRVEKFTELLNNEKYSLEEDLKKTYLKRGIDINTMNNEMLNKSIKRNELMYQLGEAIKKGSPDTDLQKFKVEIQEMNNEIRNISIRKTSLLEFSIENQVLTHTYSYLTYLLSEKKEGEIWVRVWKTFDEFLNDSSSISNRLAYYVTMITNAEEF